MGGSDKGTRVGEDEESPSVGAVASKLLVEAVTTEDTKWTTYQFA
jgi:hypothetical protein